MSKNTGLIADKLRSERVGPVTFHVAHNECLAITGASGSGKSLLLRLIADLDPHTGTLILDGENSLSMSGHVWRQRVAYFPAEPGWWSENISDHIADTPQARTLIEAVGLPERMLTAEIRGLSTGERQRLALVRGLLHHPQVLLLDEPTSALDPQSTSLIENLIMHQKNEGRIIVLVSHNAAQVERLADRRAILRDGRLDEVA